VLVGFHVRTVGHARWTRRSHLHRPPLCEYVIGKCASESML
jgi:hypothetical protein